MKVYGADFSGAKTPRIHYATADVTDAGIKVTQVIACDDRLDLFATIVDSGAAWGLDFPFALTRVAYDWLRVDGWEGLLQLAVHSSREEFAAYLEEHVKAFEGRCRDHNGFCRQTDAILGAYSGLKRFNPSMRAMLYGGLKLLAYLRNAGVQVYPFDAWHSTSARVYEVYPSHTWMQSGLRRTMDLSLFMKRWNAIDGQKLPLHIPAEWLRVATQDIADSVVACVTMAALVGQLELHWQSCPIMVTDAEWQLRHHEGVIVRV